MEDKSDRNANLRQCELCGAKFMYPSGLKRHLHRKKCIIRKNNVPSIWNHTCSICGKGFKFKSRLLKHISFQHVRITKFICDICEGKFCHKSNLIRHMKETHLSKKTKAKYKCIYCDATFIKDQGLISHMKRTCGIIKERGDKKFEELLVTNSCSSDDLQKEALRKFAEKETVDGKEYYKCNICEKLFNKFFNYQRHLQMMHIKPVEFHCTFCDAKFGQLSVLRTHLSSIHKIKCISSVNSVMWKALQEKDMKLFVSIRKRSVNSEKTVKGKYAAMSKETINSNLSKPDIKIALNLEVNKNITSVYTEDNTTGKSSPTKISDSLPIFKDALIGQPNAISVENITIAPTDMQVNNFEDLITFNSSEDFVVNPEWNIFDCDIVQANTLENNERLETFNPEKSPVDAINVNESVKQSSHLNIDSEDESKHLRTSNTNKIVCDKVAKHTISDSSITNFASKDNNLLREIKENIEGDLRSWESHTLYSTDNIPLTKETCIDKAQTDYCAKDTRSIFEVIDMLDMPLNNSLEAQVMISNEIDNVCSNINSEKYQELTNDLLTSGIDCNIEFDILQEENGSNRSNENNFIQNLEIKQSESENEILNCLADENVDKLSECSENYIQNLKNPPSQPRNKINVLSNVVLVKANEILSDSLGLTDENQELQSICPKLTYLSETNTVNCYENTDNTKPSKPKNKEKNSSSSIQCEICHQTLKQSSLKNHKCYFSSSYRYKCPICNEKFVSYGPKKRHVLGHMKNNEQTKDALKLLRKKSEEINNGLDEQTEEEAKLLKCPQCDKEFKRRANLKIHFETVHVDNKDMKSYECECGAIYIKRPSLMKHKKKYSNKPHDNPYSCRICSKICYNFLEFRRHKKTCK